MDGIDFFYNKEGGSQAEKADEERNRFSASFYAKKVNVLMAPIADQASMRYIVDRGHILLQRETKTDYLCLAFFKREATTEHAEPLFVLSVGFIATTKLEVVKSPTDSSLQKGRIRVCTRCTVDAKTGMDQVVLTIYLDVDDMKNLNTVLGSMTAKYPNQNLFFHPETYE